VLIGLGERVCAAFADYTCPLGPAVVAPGDVLAMGVPFEAGTIIALGLNYGRLPSIIWRRERRSSRSVY